MPRDKFKQAYTIHNKCNNIKVHRSSYGESNIERLRDGVFTIRVFNQHRHLHATRCPKVHNASSFCCSDCNVTLESTSSIDVILLHVDYNIDDFSQVLSIYYSLSHSLLLITAIEHFSGNYHTWLPVDGG